MRRTQLVVGLGLVMATVLLSTGPAAAHATFVSNSTVPVNSNQTLVMNVPHELGDEIWNVKVEIAVPNSWQALGCQTKSTWTCSIAAEGNFHVVTWTKANGADPAEDETFQFSVRAPATQGAYAFPTIQTYKNGAVAEWIGPSNSDEPAPVMHTGPATGPTTTVATTPPPTHTATTRPPTTACPSATTTPSNRSTVPGATTTTDPSDPTTTTSHPTSTTDPESTTTTDDDADRDEDDPDDRSERGGGGGGSDEPGSNEQASADDAGGSGGGSSALPLGAVAVVAAGGTAGFVLWRRRQPVT